MLLLSSSALLPSTLKKPVARARGEDQGRGSGRGAGGEE